MANSPKFHDTFEYVASKFPAHYSLKGTVFLKALAEALADGDAYVSTQVESVRDNLLVLTASSKYLDRLASLYGIVRGVGTGVLDDDFRRIIPILGNSPKNITHSLQQLIDVIYGPYASHANTTCTSPATYDLQDSDNLLLLIDGNIVDVILHTGDAEVMALATAQEVADAISDRTEGRVIGSVVADSRTGNSFVNIRTKTIGSQGFIQVLGGTLQTKMKFPEVRPTRQDTATWDVTRYLGSAEMIFTVTAGVSPGLRTAGVRTGDYVTIRQDSGFDSHNTGTFLITNVSEDTFRAQIPSGVPESGITQAHVDDFTFFRPDIGNILLSARPATVLQTAPRELTVVLPVTSPIVKRTLFGGHHFHGGLSVVTGTTSTTADLGSADGFPDSGTIRVISSRLVENGTCSSVSTNQISLIDGTSWPTSGAVYSPTTQTFYYFSGRSGNHLTGVTPQPLNTLAGSPLQYVQQYQYDGISDNTLQNVYPDPSPANGYEVASRVELTEGFPGSFVYDLSAPFIVASYKTDLTEDIKQGSSRTIVQVADASSLPDSGSLVMEFGTGAQEGPIRFLGKVGSHALIVDPGHVFQLDHLSGTSLRLIRQLGSYVPRVTGNDYAVYMTDTSKARALLASYLEDIAAAGVTIKFNILVPDQKWAVLPQLYAELPLDTSLA